MIPLSKRSRCGGFNLIEVLVTLAIMMLLMMLVGPPLAKYIQRSKLQGTVNLTATMMRLARIQAIKRSSLGVVQLDNSNNPYGPHVRAFVDLDRNGVWDGASEPLLGRALLERGITFLPTVGFGANGAVFQESGAAAAAGSFRFADAKGNQMEVSVVQAPTARIEIHKKNDLGAWLANGEGGKAWTWK
jgi:prepilin-type N-terminal cleavage/methylation domain-containing protein